MERITLHVPETLNDGSTVSSDQFAAYENELLELAGGFTLTHGIGAWRSLAGATYREPQRLYAVDVADAPAVRKLLALAERMAFDLEQDVFYVTSSSITDMSVLRRVAPVAMSDERSTA
jgi:hypothetical protein